eukprot:1188289-Prorocentrum_minimum.AAC.3
MKIGLQPAPRHNRPTLTRIIRGIIRNNPGEPCRAPRHNRPSLTRIIRGIIRNNPGELCNP